MHMTSQRAKLKAPVIVRTFCSVLSFCDAIEFAFVGEIIIAVFQVFETKFEREDTFLWRFSTFLNAGEN